MQIKFSLLPLALFVEILNLSMLLTLSNIILPKSSSFFLTKNFVNTFIKIWDVFRSLRDEKHVSI